MSLHPDLNRAVADLEREGIVLIIGAGCSFESPTNLPLSRPCSEEVHRRLVDDGVLDEDECECPDDLSKVTDTVVAKKDSQSEVVRRLPEEFFTARPNLGSRLAAALLREKALRGVLTLNFDLSMSHALVEIGARRDVRIVKGPPRHDQTGGPCLVYLHNNVEADDPEKLILTTSELEKQWTNDWREAISRSFLAGPVSVFAGIGTPVGVLLSTVEWLGETLGGSAQIFQADIQAHDDSTIAKTLGIDRDHYFECGWSDFMVQLSDRLTREQLQRIKDACRALVLRNGWEDDVDQAMSPLDGLSLLELGKLRARISLASDPYAVRRSIREGLIADLILVLAAVADRLAASVVIDGDGSALMRTADREVQVLLVSGQGELRRLELLSTVTEGARATGTSVPSVVLAGGMQGMRASDASPPQDIVSGTRTASILEPQPPIVLEVDDLRESPEAIDRILEV